MSAASRVQVAVLRGAGNAYGAVVRFLRRGREDQAVKLRSREVEVVGAARRAALTHLHRLTFDLQDELRMKDRGRDHDVPETIEQMRRTIATIRFLDPACSFPPSPETGA